MPEYIISFSLNAFLALFLGILGFLLRRLWQEMDDHRRKHEQHRLAISRIREELPKNYIRRDDLAGMEDRIEKSLLTVFARVESLEDRIREDIRGVYKKLDTKADK